MRRALGSEAGVCDSSPLGGMDSWNGVEPTRAALAQCNARRSSTHSRRHRNEFERALIRAHRYDEAIEKVKKVLELDLGYVRAHGRLAIAHLHQGHWTKRLASSSRRSTLSRRLALAAVGPSRTGLCVRCLGEASRGPSRPAGSRGRNERPLPAPGGASDRPRRLGEHRRGVALVRAGREGAVVPP